MAVPKYTSPLTTAGVAWTTPITSLESAAGNRHFSISRPTFPGPRVFSAGLNRQPAGSWLYVGQSAGSAPRARGRTAAQATAAATDQRERREPGIV